MVVFTYDRSILIYANFWQKESIRVNIVRLSKRKVSGNHTAGAEMKMKHYSFASARNKIRESDDGVTGIICTFFINRCS